MEKKIMTQKHDRREFLKRAAASVTSLSLGGESLAAVASDVKAQAMDKVRIGVVGIGARGTVLLRVLLDLEGVEVKAVCDIIEDRVAKAQNLVVEAGQAKPNGYARSETDFKRLCETEELDLVINAVRPWKWHVPISVAAMTAGKHAATEVPASETIEGCWHLVETAEKTQKYCVILENCCYFRNVMLVHNMLRKGLFGEVRHCEAGYQHYIADPATAGRVRDGKSLTSDAFMIDDQWHRVALVWDGTNRALHVDGAEVARDTQPNVVASSGSLHIGGGKNLTAGNFWSGLIDDVRIYNRAVSP
jgi:predicted dehydrogenase